MKPVEIIRKSQSDPLWYFETYLKIGDFMSSRIIPFTLNNVQRDFFWPSMVAQEREIGMIRAIWLKARRMGASTVRAADMFRRTTTSKNIVSRIISQDLDSADVIFAMNQLFYSQLPEEIRPRVRHANKRELFFACSPKSKETGLRSRILVNTADNANLGRSSNTTHVHCSEVAFWGSAAREVMAAVEQSVSEIPGTSIVYESTAKEMGGAFYDRYMSARDNPDSKWKALFVPWFKFDAYQIPLGPGERMALDGEEKRLKYLYGLTDEQLKWRRMCIEDKCQGRIEIFRREYPATDDEAFLYSADKKKFSAELLTLLREKAAGRRLHWVGDVVNRRLKQDQAGRLLIWKPTVPGRKYVIGVDPAEGLRDECYQAIEVIDCATLEQVAEWAGMVSVRSLAEIIIIVANLYNNAKIVPEINNHGLAVVEHIVNLGYSNIALRENVDGQIGSGPMLRYGWFTSGKSKPLLEDLFESQLMAGDVVINSTKLIDELLSYCYRDDGTTGPPTGKFSDRAMAYMIGYYNAFHGHGHARAKRRMFDLREKPRQATSEMEDMLEELSQDRVPGHMPSAPGRAPAQLVYRHR